MVFQYATVREFCGPVEQITGRKVRAYTSVDRAPGVLTHQPHDGVADRRHDLGMSENCPLRCRPGCTVDWVRGRPIVARAQPDASGWGLIARLRAGNLSRSASAGRERGPGRRVHA